MNKRNWTRMAALAAVVGLGLAGRKVMRLGGHATGDDGGGFQCGAPEEVSATKGAGPDTKGAGAKPMSFPVDPARIARRAREKRTRWLAAHPPSETQKHPFRAAGAGFTTRTHPLGDVRFEEEGVSLAAGIKSRFTAFGRAGHVEPVAPLAPVEGGCDSPRHTPERCPHRLEYRRAGVTEWWAHVMTGLEQGFDLAAPPAGEGDLVFEIAHEGATKIRMHKDSRSVHYADAKGKELAYAGLAARDAKGNDLPAHMEISGTTIRLVVSDKDAVYPIVVDPIETSYTWSYSPGNTGAQFGFSIASVGDVNGDGLPDMVVGAPYDSTAGADAGAIYELHGRALSSSPFTNGGVITGVAPSKLGYAVASAGDVNGDGIGDVLVGGPAYDSSKGIAYVFKGSKSGGALSAAGSVSGAFFSTVGSSSNDWLGQSVAGGVDMNGDGYSDLMIGAPGKDYGGNYGSLEAGEFDEGTAYGYLGSSTGINVTSFGTCSGGLPNCRTTAAINPNTFEHSYTFCGSSVALGNNGQIAVGCPGITDSSKGDVLYYSDPSLATYDPSFNDINTPSNALNIGYSMTTADVNGDGYDDFVTGAAYTSNDNSENGMIVIIDGKTGSQTAYKVPNGTAGSLCGWAVANLGDTDGDGYDDVAIGCPGLGAVYIGYGSSSGLGGSKLIAIGTESDLFGAAVAGGAFDGGTWSDLVVGAPGHSSSAGIVYEYANNDTASDYQTATDTISASNATVNFYSSSADAATGTYNVTTTNGRSDTNSTFAWYRSSTGSGTGTEIATGSQTYTLTTSDNEQYLMFCVTPSDGIAGGSQACSGWTYVGPTLEVFANEDYNNPTTGTTLVFPYTQWSTGTEIDFTTYGFNDQLTSFTLYATTDSAEVWLYENTGAGGNYETMPAGANSNAGSPNVGDTWGKSYNDSFSSFRVTY